jgi:hypothetical protein
MILVTESVFRHYLLTDPRLRQQQHRSTTNNEAKESESVYPDSGGVCHQTSDTYLPSESGDSFQCNWGAERTKRKGEFVVCEVLPVGKGWAEVR